MYPLKFTGIFEGCIFKSEFLKTLHKRKPSVSHLFALCFSYEFAAEQKARVTYDNILRLSDDPDVNNVIKFLREREVVHFQRFGEAMQLLREKLNQKNVYYMNPAFDM